MGNRSSNPESDNEQDDFEERIPEKEEKPGLEIEGNLDLAYLFDPQQLREISSKLKEELGPDLMQQHHNAILKWIDDRKSRGDETITLAQFTDFLTNKYVDKDAATELFKQFDIEGNGAVDVEQFHEMLVGGCGNSGTTFRNDLLFVNGLLQDYPFTPGFLDGFTDGKTVVSKHGKKLAKFLARNRAPSNLLPLPALEGFINTMDMRLKVLQAHTASMKEKADIKKGEPPLKDDEVLKPTTKCFSSVQVSTNRNDISKLTDGDTRSYWQSDGPARSHWIRLKISPDVVIRQLSINVASVDESYMPHNIVITAGKDKHHLTEIAEVKIPSHFTGYYVLLENMKSAYPVMQLNLKRCHSDGCDTRVRQIKAVGYRVVKSKGVTVIDATAMWYLSVLASTAQAALPIAPGLRDSIIEHTRMALVHIEPLTLSSMAADKPGFLSNNVMQQMEQFLHNIVCMTDKQVPNDLCILLEFALARGSLGSIINALKILYESLDESYNASSLLKSLNIVKENAVKKHGALLQVSMDKFESKTPEAPSDDAQETGRKRVTMSFTLKTNNLINLTRAVIKLPKGSEEKGLLFVIDSLDAKEKMQVDGDKKEKDNFEVLKEYDEWTSDDYKALVEKISDGYEPKDEDPIAYFGVDKEWDDAEVQIDRIKSGRFVVVKFLNVKAETAEKLDIPNVKLYGYEIHEHNLESNKLLEKYTTLPDDDQNEPISGISLFLNILHFLEVLARDTLSIKKLSRSKDEIVVDKQRCLDLQDLSISQLWDLYKQVSCRHSDNEDLALASYMVLSLFHLTLSNPKLTSSLKVRQLTSSSSASSKHQENTQQLPAEIFHYLCDLVDEANSPMCIQKIAQDIILDGAEVFFPDAEARREHLLSLVDQVMEEKKAVSVRYTFESLCRFFSNRDASGLLGLPDCLPKANFDRESVIHVMQTLVSVAYRECIAQMEKGEQTEKPSNLVQLLSAMQKSLLNWCHTHCSSANDEARATANYIIAEYVAMVSGKTEQALKLLNQSNKKVAVIDRLEFSYLSVTMRQLVLFLNLFSTCDIPCIKLLKSLQAINLQLDSMSHNLPELFNQANSDDWKEKQQNVVLRSWEVESKHKYDNNMHSIQVFSCPGCLEFKVEFDPKCETEKRYDYLEFTDSKDRKRRFDQRAGTTEWPLTVDFKAGQKLHFLFHSDGSNNEWGYKFKVTAIGRPDIAVTWIFDLQLNLGRLFGILCSNALDCRRALETQTEKAGGELALLHSELWSTLFRGGYRVGKLQRSLSGYYGSSPADSQVNGFLVALCENKEENAKEFIKKCRASRNGHYLGGEKMDAAVNSVFAALIWHTQVLREQIAPFVSENPLADIPSGLMSAFIAAENVRRVLLEKRQKLLVLVEEGKTGDETTDVEMKDSDEPINSCKEKSLFLLKFAGLSKLPKKLKEGETAAMLNRKSSIHRSRSWNKQDSIEFKTSRHHMEDLSIYEKYPTFQMVTDFVTNEALSPERIQALLKQRHQYASNVADIYAFAKDYLQHQDDVAQFKPHVVLFLQQLLHCQQNFPRHYCDFLNGCGLEYENKVRKQFYSFLRCLCQAAKQESSHSEVSSFFESARAYLLHFLTVDWKPYDHSFILEIELPKLLIDASRDTAFQPGNDIEQFEMEMYDKHMKYFKEVKSTYINAWCQQYRENACRDVQRNINLFIARFSEQLDVQITCDGCDTSLSGRRYRCLNCVDMDLCAKCYDAGEKPEGHSEDHDIIDLRFKCDNCESFIVGTRMHCTECVNFDLCYGCWKTQQLPSPHEAAHTMTKHTMSLGAIFTKSHKTDSLQTYVHFYSWLQFSSLVLSLSESLQERKSTGLDVEYSRVAAELLLICLNSMSEILEDAVKSARVSVDKTDKPMEVERTDSEASHGSLTRQSAVDHEMPDVNDPATENTTKSSDAVGSADSSTPDTVIPTLEGAESSATTVPISMETDDEPLPDSADSSASSPAEPTQEPSSPSSPAKETEAKVEEPNIKPRDLFSTVAQERILGLIGALLPINRQLTSYPSHEKFLEFISMKLIPVLLRLLRSDKSALKTRIIAIGVLSKTLRCITPKVADEGVTVVEKADNNQEEYKEDSEGVKTVQLLFKLGAECLERGDLDTASALETALQQLTCTGKWHSSVTEHANACLRSLAEDSKNPTLPSLFALMVFAGFPDVYRIGTLAKVTETGGEAKDIIIVDYHQDRGVASALNFKSRKLKSVKEHLIEDDEAWSEGIDANRIPVLLAIIKDVLATRKYLHGSVEQKWVRALVLKALLGNLKAGISSSDFTTIMKSGVIPLVVNLACQGTRFSKQWLLRDLEVLSWKLYKQVHDPVKEPKSEQPVTHEPENKDPLEGLGADTKETFVNIHDALSCSYSILRAMYEYHGRDDDKLREEVQRSLMDSDGVDLTTSNEIKELAKKWEITETQEAKTPATDKTLDIGVLGFTPQLTENKDLCAKPESGETTHKLITSLTEAEKNESRVQQRRSKSGELLREALETGQKSENRDLIKKVNHAVAVGYARHLVAWLFTMWPKNERISRNYLSNHDASKVVGLLDLIQEAESKDQFEKVVFNFVRLCDKDLVKPLAISAVHCMGEVQLASVTKESDHKYKHNTRVEDKVTIPGATSLFIKFDDRCATEYSCDELTIASSPNYVQNKKVYSGLGVWQECEMPGDTVYYKFTSDASNNDWGWKFTVTGGQLGRFETGCGILNGLLAQDIEFARSLPLKQLWSWLIVVACDQVGQQRLMATGLLLRILHIAAGDPLLFAEPVQPLGRDAMPDLSLLRPLWKLYTKTMVSETATSVALMSPVLRGLSELFLVVENVAQDFGMAEELVAKLATEDKLRKRLTQAVTNIAAIGLAIGIPNKALDLIRNAPTCPPDCKDNPTDETKESSTVQSSAIEITGNNSEWSESEDQEDDTQDEDDMEIDGANSIPSSSSNSTLPDEW